MIERDSLNLPVLGVRQNVREQIADALRAALVAGEMRPGLVYSAPTLAARFGVSATPVREAMLDLAKEGLVTPVRNKGFRVTALSDRDLDEITEVRSLIEVPTVRRIAETVEPERSAQLRPLAEDILAAAERRDILAYIEADQVFHIALLGLAGNSQLIGVVRDLRHRSRLYGVPSLAERGELIPSAREHLDLLDLIGRADGAGAEALMRHHLGHVRGIWADRPEPA
ncbi:GntR family transcriptional regulator [Actinomadura alba]|uniref:GntR family transcriptional regulator n=1 Tax=Actinomadura alba TaxID=406431 RepID=A0ABR7LQL7_9ACTN|nr:GntR family transcriptional regulator [Actinomadura alba]MBC6467106.1 GntR family transcriptional regulator [Actinomadura alba]